MLPLCYAAPPPKKKLSPKKKNAAWNCSEVKVRNKTFLVVCSTFFNSWRNEEEKKLRQNGIFIFLALVVKVSVAFIADNCFPKKLIPTLSAPDVSGLCYKRKNL